MVALDSATLGRMSRNYWAEDASSRDKARLFIQELLHAGVFLAFSEHHVVELLRHGDDHVFENRLRFLRGLPLIAWLRPYDRSWFPGSIADLFLRELHAVVHDSTRDWPGIVNRVRPDLWETGTGSEMFVENDGLWAFFRQGSRYLHEKEKYVASMGRVDPAQCGGMTVRETLTTPLRPKDERDAYIRWFAQELEYQLNQHGDKRLNYSHEIAVDFSDMTLQDMSTIDGMTGNLIERLVECAGVPYECVSPKMTITEVGELAVYASRLKTSSRDLRPPVRLTIKDVPLGALPS